MALNWGQFGGSLLSGLGQGLLSAGSPGGNFGQGFRGGMQDFQQQQQAAQLQQLREMQLKQSQQSLDSDALANTEAAAEQKKWTDYLAQQEGMMTPIRPGGPVMGGHWTPDQLQILKQLPAKEGRAIVAQRELAQPKNEYHAPINVGGHLYDPMDPTKEIADYSAQEIAAKQAGASSTNVVVDTGNKENAKTIGKYWGDKLGEVMDAGFAAPKTIAKYQRLGSLLDQAGSGTFTKTGADIKKALKGAGFDPEAFGIQDNTSAVDAAESVTNQLALEMRNPSGGAGMPGAMSDSDREFLANTVPNLSKTPGGNKLIIEAAVKMAKRDAEVSKMANDYAQKHSGIIDGGFFEQLQQWSDAHPLFDEASQAPEAPAESEPTATGPDGKTYVVRDGQWVPK